MELDGFCVREGLVLMVAVPYHVKFNHHCPSDPCKRPPEKGEAENFPVFVVSNGFHCLSVSKTGTMLSDNCVLNMFYATFLQYFKFQLNNRQ